ncbi:MAG TPA: D-cysteine desulfhydrase family protein [Anaeromyxobacteraceae bacterium]|nr:D-cysteine desulfhydrase family protein [Anaeromyxobacteraceae bacterium]
MVPDSAAPARIALARLPTPLEPSPRLGAQLGLELLYKRDDLTGLELSGNKARKLEFLLAEALAQGADTVVTLGGVQSNHCRATAFAAARLGLRCELLLRVPDPSKPPPLEANALLDRVAGADVRWLSPREYQRRDELVDELAHGLQVAGRRPYVIPVGGSNPLGCWGYALAVEELRAQLPPSWEGKPVTIAVACGSGGTAAGVALGIRRLGWKEARAVAFAVCDDAAYFRQVIAGLASEASRRWPGLPPLEGTELEVDDRFVGPGYAQATPEGLALIRRVARADGLLLDPVYTGKAFQGLVARAGELGPRVVFIHTGGSFGLLPFGARLLDEGSGPPQGARL